VKRNFTREVEAHQNRIVKEWDERFQTICPCRQREYRGSETPQPLHDDAILVGIHLPREVPLNSRPPQ
jgi:hypothetical protein